MATKFAEGYVQLRADMAALRKDLAASKQMIVRQVTGMEAKVQPMMAGMFSPRMLLGGAGVFAAADISREVLTFEDAMRKSTAIMTGADERMDELSATARRVAKELGVSHTAMAKSYFYLASAGLDAARSMQALPTAALFAKAGQIENMSLAVDMLTDVQSAMGMTGESAEEYGQQMKRLSDVIIRGNELANASTQQYAEALVNRFAASLKTTGKSVEEGTALLAALADQGRKGALAGRSSTIWMRELGRQSRENAGAFEKYGIEVYDSTGKMKAFADIVRDLENALGHLSPKAQGAAIAQLGLVEIAADVTKMLLGTSAALERYTKELLIAAGATERVAGKNMESFLELLKRMKAGLVDTMIDALQPLVEGLRPFVDALISAAEAMRQANELSGGFLTQFAAMGVTVMALAGGVKLLVGAFAALGAAMLAHPYIALVAASLAGLSQIIRELTQETIEWDDQAQKTYDAHRQQAESASAYAEQLTALAGREKLNNEEMAQARELIEDLTDSYGNLGIEIDEATSKLKGFGKAQQLQLDIRMAEKEVEALRDLLFDAGEKYEALWRLTSKARIDEETMREFGAEFGSGWAEALHKDPDLLEAALAKQKDRLRLQYLELQRAKTRLAKLRLAQEGGEKEAAQEAAESVERRTKEEAQQLADLYDMRRDAERELRDFRIEQIEDVDKRERATIEARYADEREMIRRLMSETGRGAFGLPAPDAMREIIGIGRAAVTKRAEALGIVGQRERVRAQVLEAAAMIGPMIAGAALAGGAFGPPMKTDTKELARAQHSGLVEFHKAMQRALVDSESKVEKQQLKELKGANKQLDVANNHLAVIARKEGGVFAF